MKDTVLVTGASGGLGLELARLFAKDGCDVILTARSEPKLREIAAQFAADYGVTATPIAADLSQPDGVDALMAAVNGRGFTVDVLVNNAGFGDFGPFAECDMEKQEKMIALNVTALVKLTHAVLPAMKAKKHGKILQVASIASFQAGPLMSIYYATKAFVLSFSQALSRELKGSGITVTALCPGPIKTGFEDAANLDNSKLFSSLKVSTAEDVAAYGYRATQKGRRIAVHGALNKLTVFAVRFAPRSLVANVVYRIQGQRFPQA